MWKSIDKEMGAGDEEGVDPYKRHLQSPSCSTGKNKSDNLSFIIMTTCHSVNGVIIF